VTPAELVLDASVLVLGVLGTSREAGELLDRVASGDARAHAPDLIAAESTNALLGVLRAGAVTVDQAAGLVATASTLPLERHRCAGLAETALAVAHARGLTAYDAFYAVLADALDVPLVTADRTLAAATPRAVLVSQPRATRVR
jgi:predicted nucleic acid-binding protein